MRCAISSRAGQILARGRLVLQPEDDQFRLCFKSDRGTVIEGGIVDSDGDLSSAGETLFNQFYQTWGMSDLTLIASKPSVRKQQMLQSTKSNIELL